LGLEVGRDLVGIEPRACAPHVDRGEYALGDQAVEGRPRDAEPGAHVLDAEKRLNPSRGVSCCVAVTHAVKRRKQGETSAKPCPVNPTKRTPPTPRRGPGSRAPRKPLILELVRGYLGYYAPGPALGFEFLRRLEAGYTAEMAKRPPTSAQIAEMVLEHLAFLEHMAEVEPNMYLVKLERARVRARLNRVPVNDQLAGEGDADAWAHLNRDLRAQIDYHRREARALRGELGEGFLRGSPEQRATMVRGWVSGFREQGRLPALKRS
jgi:hypothetical protein